MKRKTKSLLKTEKAIADRLKEMVGSEAGMPYPYAGGNAAKKKPKAKRKPAARA